MPCEQSGARRLRFFLGYASAFICLATTSVARGHLGHVVDGAERYLKFDAQPDGLRVVVSMTYGPAATLRAMGDADLNDDQRVDATEADAYMRRFAEGLSEGLIFRVDGEPIVPEWGEPYFDPQGEFRPTSGAAEMVASIALAGGEHSVEVLDRMADARIDRTDVAFRAAPEGELLGGGLREAQSPPAPFSYANEEEVRMVVTLRTRGVTPSPWVLGAIIITGLFTGAFLSVYLRTRKRRT